ncbi:conserved hypothetical protein [Nitrosococcus halophilus Nc 4]|uniref:Polymerase nucleotidyl transferase domain-containing protein n=1 Tax=Nitrosococcus halophilus (strain Nc4) TaxID=472759 RepID=D5BVH8_NITHN|nr:hypothetical protein [Nitrosococcus halophilus]ADE13606.1 conserved hypothetical protein [Nitrosococcus halophilus Nc 4]
MGCGLASRQASNAAKIRPRDFVETQEGLIFSVVTHHQEEGRALGVLRYVKKGACWRKVNTPQADSLLETHYPYYLYDSPRLDARLHGVPVTRVVRHYQSQLRLAEILTPSSGDEIEEKVRGLVQLFEAGGLYSQNLGITGSLLIGVQQVGSDIDLVVYGQKNFQQARRIIKQALTKGQLDPLDETLWRETYKRRGCSLDFQEYLWHERRKYNKAVWEGTKFDIVLVSRPEEIKGDSRYFHKQGKRKLQAQIKDGSEAFAYPARYRLVHAEIDTVVAFSHTYVGQAETGEWVEVVGQLERASDGELRIVVGSSREALGEYIKVIPLP